jgi:pyruvate dehydrogenase E1 component
MRDACCAYGRQVDGEYQNFKANDGAFVRKHFFGKDPKLLEVVSRMTDDDIWRLNRGGHDPPQDLRRVRRRDEAEGQPTVILAKTVKGYGMGKVGEGRNPTHQLKKLDTTAIREFRDRFAIPCRTTSSRMCRTSNQPTTRPK